jgi:coenzyme F420 hydrogenase subunit beta
MKFPENVKWVVENDLCTGCGLCKVACPRKAIKMTYDNKRGLILPIVDEKICSKCGICLEVCPGFKVDDKLYLQIFNYKPSSIVGNYKNAYIGFAKDQELRFSSTSGGIVTALLTYLLEERVIDGAVVTKMDEFNPPIAKCFIATTARELFLASGSKYCPVSLAECLEKLEYGKKYAVVGLPCQIYGIRKLTDFNPKIRNSVYLYLGILCGGMPSYLGTQYLLKVYGMEKQHIRKFEYRGGGWPGRLLIQGESEGKQKNVSVPYPEYWQGTFGYFKLFRCTICYNGFNEFSDISCGDAWLPEIMAKDKIGTSLIITRTEIGEKLLHDAFQKGRIQITPIDDQDVIRSQQGLYHEILAIKSRLNLLRIMRRKLPPFDLSRIPNTNQNDYISTIDLYVGRTLASRKNLLWLLNVYVSSKRTIGRVIRRIKCYKSHKFKNQKHKTKQGFNDTL